MRLFLRNSASVRSFSVLVSTVLLGWSSLVLAAPFAGDGNGTPLSVQRAGTLTGAVPVVMLPDFADLAEHAGPAVVNISTSIRVPVGSDGRVQSEEQMREFMKRFFGAPDGAGKKSGGRAQAPEEDVPRGVGAGFIVTPDGYIITNAHVVDGASNITVTLTDKREFKARLVGADARSDVALIKIDASRLPTLPIGDSEKVRAGQWVIAIGSPFGLDNTVTAGIISAKSRDIGDYLKLIQSDVSVNPGNSGGPLLNMRGEVVGITSQIYSGRSGGSTGISFAIPIDEALAVANELKLRGRIVRGRIGVQTSTVSRDVAESLNLGSGLGTQVERIEPNGPAARAGILPGDIITAINGQRVDSSGDLQRTIGGIMPGENIKVSVWRHGVSRDVVINVSEMSNIPEDTAVSPVPRVQTNVLGLASRDPSFGERRDYRLLDGTGIIVVTSTGAAARASMRQGDIILRLNNTDITDVAQFNALVGALDRSRAAVLLVKRGDVTQYIPIKF